jgi:putative hemolysin
MALFLFAVLFALSASAICSLLEACLLSFTPGQVATLAHSRPRLGRLWQRFKQDIQKPIAVILIINTAAHTIGATVAGSQFEKVFILGFGFGPNSLVVFSLVFTFLMLLFTEILPKTFGVVHNVRLAPVIAYPLDMLVKVFRPILYLVHLINRPFEPKEADERPPQTLESIVALAGLARLSKLIGAQQERIIKGASQLADIPVREVMIPIDQVFFVSSSQTLDEAILAAHHDPHTRFPVCEGESRDRVLGYVNFKELVFQARFKPEDPTLDSILRPVYFAAPDDSSADLLRVFVEGHVHMAIVREGEKTVGLITLEDIVEELVGELEDEFDRLPRMFHEMRGGQWMVGGGFSVAELGSRLGVDLPDGKGSLSSWLIQRMGRIPHTNESHTEAGFQFTVRRTRRGRIFEVTIRKI